MALAYKNLEETKERLRVARARLAELQRAEEELLSEEECNAMLDKRRDVWESDPDLKDVWPHYVAKVMTKAEASTYSAFSRADWKSKFGSVSVGKPKSALLS